MNVSWALAWMGQASIAAGLWGNSDYQQMLQKLKVFTKKIKPEFTLVDTDTRRNITIVDTAKNKEMHLRNKSELATKNSLKKLKADLKKIVIKNSICVFSGSMPQDLLNETASLINYCSQSGAKIAVDTSGRPLSRIVAGGTWLIKPNIDELSELLNTKVANTAAALVRAGRQLLDKVEIVLISRGSKGAIVLTEHQAWQAAVDITTPNKVLCTVGCGDYLLAGFLKGLQENYDIAFALEKAIKAATAHVWGFSGVNEWGQLQKQIKVKMTPA